MIYYLVQKYNKKIQYANIELIIFSIWYNCCYAFGCKWKKKVLVKFMFFSFRFSGFTFSIFCISAQNFSIFHFRQTSFYATFFNQKFTSTKMNIADKRDSISYKISAQNFSIFFFDKQVFTLLFSAKSLQVQK